MVKLDGVEKRYDDSTNLRFKDYVFRSGESYCILGPSGCGKSTLLNLISGRALPTSGKVVYGVGTVSRRLFDGPEPDGNKILDIGYTMQELLLLEDFSVMDNMMIVPKADKQSVLLILELLLLSGKTKTKAKNLSGGERQRLAIARNLLRSFDIALYDEPTASVNFDLANLIMKLITNEHKKTNNTLIVVTHDERLTGYFDHVIGFDNLIVGESN
ncbi:ABC transporter ATP-binding protein YtrE [compost metagenome]